MLRKGDTKTKSAELTDGEEHQSNDDVTRPDRALWKASKAEGSNASL